jgi:hypothetical protein
MMIVYRRFVVGIVITIALLAGCAAEPTKPKHITGLDDRWVGYFESSLGVLGCPARGPMEVEIENGRIAGDAIGNGFTMSVNGVLAANGAIKDGLFRRDDRAAAIVTGTFLNDDAAGRWQGASCEGLWTLRRIRK